MKGLSEDISTVEYASMLYDFYGALLSNNQREIMSLYHEDNLSLSEIAEEIGTTRQAVHYTLKKAEHALAGYEDKLGLLKTYRHNQELAEKAQSILSQQQITNKDIIVLTNIIRELSE